MSRLLFSIVRNVITDSVSKRSRRSTLFFEIPIYWDLGDPGYLSVTKDQFLDLFISLSILTNDQKKLIACFSTQSAVDWPLVKYCWSLLWAGLRWTPPCNSVRNRKRGGIKCGKCTTPCQSGRLRWLLQWTWSVQAIRQRDQTLQPREKRSHHVC